MAQIPEIANLPTTSLEVEENNALAFDEDVIFEILVKLPAHEVYDLRYVSKPWLKIIRNPIFINTNLSRSKAGVLVAQQNPENDNKYDTRFIGLEVLKEEAFNVQDLNLSCKARIMASCNGLLLLRDTYIFERLYVVNPITKQFETLPLTSIREHEFIGCGFTFIPSTKEYKVVRVYSDFRKKRIGYEILSSGFNAWKWVERRRVGRLCWYYTERLVSVKEILHWQTFFTGKDGSKFMFSLDMIKEKCQKTRLPNGTIDMSLSTIFVEMSGFLSMIIQNRLSPTHIDIWILKNFYGGEWVKQHSLVFEFLREINDDFISPVACLNNGKVIIFRRYETLKKCYFFSYDLDLQQHVRLWNLQLTGDHEIMLHVNSLMWWKES